MALRQASRTARTQSTQLCCAAAVRPQSAERCFLCFLAAEAARRPSCYRLCYALVIRARSSVQEEGRAPDPAVRGRGRRPAVAAYDLDASMPPFRILDLPLDLLRRVAGTLNNPSAIVVACSARDRDVERIALRQSADDYERARWGGEPGLTVREARERLLAWADTLLPGGNAAGDVERSRDESNVGRAAHRDPSSSAFRVDSRWSSRDTCCVWSEA